MRFLANDNFPKDSVDILNNNNIDTLSISKIKPGISDTEVINISNNDRRIILTFDKDYGELIYKNKIKPINGVILFRWNFFKPETPALFLLEKINSFTFENKFTIISHNSIRQRNIKL